MLLWEKKNNNNKNPFMCLWPIMEKEKKRKGGQESATALVIWIIKTEVSA